MTKLYRPAYQKLFQIGEAVIFEQAALVEVGGEVAARRPEPGERRGERRCDTRCRKGLERDRALRLCRGGDRPGPRDPWNPMG